MGNKKIMPLNTAKSIIKKTKKSLIYFKYMKRKMYLSFKYILKSYPAYDESFFYKKMKPYLEGKNIQYLLDECWIKENHEKKIDYKKNLCEAKSVEAKRFFIYCAGDPLIWENTYGTPCPFNEEKT